jgi:hypothetical protein
MRLFLQRAHPETVAELKSAITEHVANHNADLKSFVWAKFAGEILEKVARARNKRWN